MALHEAAIEMIFQAAEHSAFGRDPTPTQQCPMLAIREQCETVRLGVIVAQWLANRGSCEIGSQHTRLAHCMDAVVNGARQAGAIAAGEHVGMRATLQRCGYLDEATPVHAQARFAQPAERAGTCGDDKASSAPAHLALANEGAAMYGLDRGVLMNLHLGFLQVPKGQPPEARRVAGKQVVCAEQVDRNSS